MEKQYPKQVIIRFTMLIALHDKGWLYNLGPYHNNIKARLQEHSPVQYTYDKHAVNTEFCSLASHSYLKATTVKGKATWYLLFLIIQITSNLLV